MVGPAKGTLYCQYEGTGPRAGTPFNLGKKSERRQARDRSGVKDDSSVLTENTAARTKRRQLPCTVGFTELRSGHQKHHQACRDNVIIFMLMSDHLYQ